MLRNRLTVFASAAVLSANLGACVSVPADAPEEIREAQAQLDRAEDLETSELFPKSVMQSEDEFDMALDLYKSVPEEERGLFDWSDHDAVKQAALVSRRMQTANQLKSEMDALDGKLDSIEGQGSLLQMSAQVASLRQQLAEMTQKYEDAKAEIEAARLDAEAGGSRFALLEEMTLRGPTVFFETAKAQIQARDLPALRELATALKENPKLQLNIVGYADPRGDEVYNAALSQKRAQAVRDYLVSRGIASKQLKVSGLGEQAAFYRQGVDKLQIERRVETIVTPMF